MRALLTRLRDELDHDTLVFPSQIAVDFWRRFAISGRARTAIREDAIISWDTFKEFAFDLRTDRPPANRIVRTVFVERLIADNARNPVLREIIPPGFAPEAQGFRNTLLGILPRIPAALTVLRGADSRRLRAVQQDLRTVQQAYTDFLDQYGLFEPRWLQAAQHFRGGSYVLVAPELADDFGEFESAVATLPRIDPEADESPVFRMYPDSVIELRSVLRQIGQLIVSGTDPEEIYLTVADFDRTADRLIHEAGKYDIPVSLSRGAPLSDSAIGRLLIGLSDLVASGFGLDAFESVVLNRAVPWKRPDINVDLVVAGARHGCLGGGDRPDARWSTVRLEASDETKAVLGRLLRLVPAVVGATSCAALRSAFNEFLAVMIDRDSWEPSDERVLQRCQDELRLLAQTELDLGLSVAEPFRFWCDRLAEQQYVPQRPGVGVQVVPYKVGALVCPQHHFVIGVNQVSTTVRTSSVPFLTDADRAEVETELSDRDLTTTFLDAYTESGVRVEFSAARKTHDGTALPSGYFLGRDLSSGNWPRTDRLEDVYEQEIGLLSFVPSSVQVSGLQSYLRHAGERGPDYTREQIADPVVLKRVHTNLRSTRSGRVNLSSSSIESFRVCPFEYLLGYGLGVEELDFEVDPDDGREIGRLYHDILAAFFAGLAADGERFHRGNLEEYRRQLRSLSTSMHRKRRGMNPDIVNAARLPLFERIAEAVLEHDAEMIDGHEALLVEDWRRDQEIMPGFVLVGRIDRATRAPDGTVSLVDYKKSRLPKRKEINGGAETAVPVDELTATENGDPAAEVTAIQIPLYVRLVESEGERISSAGYYSLEEASYLPVISDGADENPCMDRERFDQVLMLVDGIVRNMIGRIESGDFTCGRCEGCGLRTVCRTRYHVR